MSIMTLDFDEEIDLLDLGFELILTSAPTYKRENDGPVADSGTTLGGPSGPLSADPCCISARSHTGC